MSDSAIPESARMESGSTESGRISDLAILESARMDSGRKESGRISDWANPDYGRKESRRNLQEKKSGVKSIEGCRPEIMGGPHPFGQKSGTPPTLSKILLLGKKINQNRWKKAKFAKVSKST
jgi:hypothetical protein